MAVLGRLPQLTAATKRRRPSRRSASGSANAVAMERQPSDAAKAAKEALLAGGWQQEGAVRAVDALERMKRKDGYSGLWDLARGARAPPIERESKQGVWLAPGGGTTSEVAALYSSMILQTKAEHQGIGIASVRNGALADPNAASPIACVTSMNYETRERSGDSEIGIACFSNGFGGKFRVAFAIGEQAGELNILPSEVPSALNGGDESSRSIATSRETAGFEVARSLFGPHAAAAVEEALVHSECVVVAARVPGDMQFGRKSELRSYSALPIGEAEEGEQGDGLVDCLKEMAGGGGSAASRATTLVHPQGSAWQADEFRASGPPLYQTATFAQPGALEMGPYDYTRSGNPTRDLLEQQMAELEGAAGSVAYATGMLAISSAIRLVASGGRVVAPDDLYGGTSRLLENVVPNQGVEVVYANPADLDSWQEKIEGGATGMVIIESPTNPRLQIADIRGICDLARRKGAISLVDNSVMAPLLQSPLELGADISMTSATKFLSGHGDLTGGVLSAATSELADALLFRQNAEGTMLPPFDCWLCLRGLKTMSARMKRQQENAERIASFLQSHPKVERVNYPGLQSHPGFAVHASQACGPGSILSFETGDTELSRQVTEGTRLFKITVSFGAVNSLISMPCYMSHASIPESVRAERGLPNNLVRISAGVEDVGDLLADLDAALGPRI